MGDDGGRWLKAGGVSSIIPAFRAHTGKNMSPAVKFFLGLALVVLLLLASPFLVEAGIRRYDRKRDPYTGPAAVVMEAGAARQGLNRRLYPEQQRRAAGGAPSQRPREGHTRPSRRFRGQ